MANNLQSYSRFALMPSNISTFGYTAEEFRSAAGAPAKEPEVGPMADVRVSETRLALAPKGSDALRLAKPSLAENPYEGPHRTLSLTRSCLTKLGSKILADLREVTAAAGKVGPLMDDSIARVQVLHTRMRDVLKMTEGVTARVLSASKG